MFTVQITPQAAEDLLEIKNYIENELQNPIAAHNTIKTIVETYENLSTIAETDIPVEDMFPFQLIINLFWQIIIQSFTELMVIL